MKASELRIENLINIGGNTLDTYQTYKPTKVTLAILNEIAGENEERPDAELSVFMPLPLTEDWLKRFGFFKERKRPSRYHKNFFSIEFNDSNIVLAYAPFRKDWGFYIEYTDSPDPKDNKTKYFVSCGIKYVHQLQNLYFALTGEELKLREE